MVLYRPLAFPLVLLLARTPVTPNQVTLAAFLVTVLTGALYFKATTECIVAAGLVYLASRILDCVDGQLARAKSQFSKLGKLYDGLSDYFGHIAVMIGMGFAFGSGDLSEQIPLLSGFMLPAWLAAVLSGFSLVYQCILADKYKNEYLSRKFPNRKPPSEELKEFEIEKSKSSGIEKLLLTVFIGYLKIQNRPDDRNQVQESAKAREIYCLGNRKTLFAWNLLGPSMHANLIILFSVIDRIELYAPAAIIAMNLATLPLHLWQWHTNKSLRKEIATNP